MGWYKAVEAARLLGVSSPEALRKRGRRGTAERKWDTTRQTYMYFVDDDSRESVLDNIELLYEEEEREEDEDFGHYDTSRDF